MAWFSKDDYVRTPYRRRRAANYRTLVLGLLLVFSFLILALLAVLVLAPMQKDLPDPSSWEFAMIDSAFPLSDEFSVTVLALPEDYTDETIYFDARAYDALCKMLADAADLGYTPIVVRGYESADMARERFFAEQRRLRQSGFSASEAYTLALKSVPLPGLSEFRLGLCVDFSCREDVLDFENTQFFDWLTDHAHEYGFILRHSQACGEHADHSFDASIWRYVGADAARQIKKRDDCLESYIDYIQAEFAQEQEKKN